MVPFSVLDLSPITAGSTASQALRNTLDLAKHAEGWGYHRYWIAEHHNLTGVAGAATAVVIGQVANETSSMRVGAGGIMLPNHAPLIIAEQFGTLASLHPGRIDLGVGRAAGTDLRTAHALRRNLQGGSSFEQDVAELEAYFNPATEGQAIRAVPGAGLEVPIWLLGSSLFSAQLAAKLGLPFAFASHFAPATMMDAISLYRQMFSASPKHHKPYVMVGLNVFAADTDRQASRLFTSLQQQFLNLRRGTPGQLQPPIETMEERWDEAEQEAVSKSLAFSIVGSARIVSYRLKQLLEETRADELIITGQIYDHEARLRSFEIIAEVREMLAD